MAHPLLHILLSEKCLLIIIIVARMLDGDDVQAGAVGGRLLFLQFFLWFRFTLHRDFVVDGLASWSYSLLGDAQRWLAPVVVLVVVFPRGLQIGEPQPMAIQHTALLDVVAIVYLVLGIMFIVMLLALLLLLLLLLIGLSFCLFCIMLFFHLLLLLNFLLLFIVFGVLIGFLLKNDLGLMVCFLVSLHCLQWRLLWSFRFLRL
mmetsp:Transcript_51252/g.108933  ORF Transcript_51252/g.108933 Transcript_51252/m.108933 type:complete len:203 (-) Transcript_51252:159-767(-)